MSPFRVYLYTNSRGDTVIENLIASIAKSQTRAASTIYQRLKMLESHGVTPQTAATEALRQVEGATLYELKTRGRPAYRIFVARLSESNIFVVLDVRQKKELDTHQKMSQAIGRCLDRLDHWMADNPTTSPE